MYIGKGFRSLSDDLRRLGIVTEAEAMKSVKDQQIKMLGLRYMGWGSYHNNKGEMFRWDGSKFIPTSIPKAKKALRSPEDIKKSGRELEGALSKADLSMFGGTTPENREMHDIVQSMEMGDKYLFSGILKNTKGDVKKALEITVNNVDGDATQLPEKLVKFAKKQGWHIEDPISESLIAISFSDIDNQQDVADKLNDCRQAGAKVLAVKAKIESGFATAKLQIPGTREQFEAKLKQMKGGVGRSHAWTPSTEIFNLSEATEPDARTSYLGGGSWTVEVDRATAEEIKKQFPRSFKRSHGNPSGSITFFCTEKACRQAEQWLKTKGKSVGGNRMWDLAPGEMPSW